MIMSTLSKKPYIIRAIYEWCADSALTPYLSVKVDQYVRVPMEYVKNGEIVLSVSLQATRNLTMGNDLIQFSARFNGVSREISVPMHAVQAIFARENGQGYFFEAEAAPESLTGLVTNAAPFTSPLPAPHVPALQAVPKFSTELIDTKEANDADDENALSDVTSSPSPSSALSPQSPLSPSTVSPIRPSSNTTECDPDNPSPPRGGLRVIK
ncbi:MAG: ClpXP protease specificity-enhancing factor [Gammaproteobacteria bacterium]|nr:ClpXP protease specificity-enhancing factor [Gammaproteobacteria bacterium]